MCHGCTRKQMGYRFLETFQISVQTITMVLSYGATIGEKRYPRFSISLRKTMSCQDKLRVNVGKILGVSRSNRGVQCTACSGDCCYLLWAHTSLTVRRTTGSATSSVAIPLVCDAYSERQRRRWWRKR